MPPSHGHQWTPIVITCALVATAVTASAVRGTPQAAVAAALVGGLLIAYFVRHRVRARLVYDRPEAAPDEDDRPRSAPAPAASERP